MKCIFIKKLLLLFVLYFVVVIGIIYSNFALKILFQILLGALIAHSVELDHELGHHQHFSKNWLNKLVGFILSAPFLMSHTKYRITHAHHHKALGTIEDKESFAYDFERLNTFTGCILHLLMLNHYWEFINSVKLSFKGKLKENLVNFSNNKVIKEISNEYKFMSLLIGFLTIISLMNQNNLIVEIWVIPLMLFAGPIHALIELPEHFNCNKQSKDIFENSRTINAGPLMAWFTNGNCWHVEHHLNPSVSIYKLHEIHNKFKHRIRYVNDSYFNFYYTEIFKKLVGGYSLDKNI